MLSYIGQDCGGTFKNATGAFTSPNYPSDYPRRSDCVWIIAVPNSESYSVEIVDFATEQDYDILSFGTGTTEDVNTIDTLSGTVIAITIPIQSSSIWFHFTSDNNVAAKGFSIAWTAQGI